jgi:hypothetical protein
MDGLVASCPFCSAGLAAELLLVVLPFVAAVAELALVVAVAYLVRNGGGGGLLLLSIFFSHTRLHFLLPSLHVTQVYGNHSGPCPAMVITQVPALLY